MRRGNEKTLLNELPLSTAFTSANVITAAPLNNIQAAMLSKHIWALPKVLLSVNILLILLTTQAIVLTFQFSKPFHVHFISLIFFLYFLKDCVTNNVQLILSTAISSRFFVLFNQWPHHTTCTFSVFSLSHLPSQSLLLFQTCSCWRCSFCSAYGPLLLTFLFHSFFLSFSVWLVCCCACVTSGCCETLKTFLRVKVEYSLLWLQLSFNLV